MVMYAFHYQSYLQVFATCIVSEGFFVLDLTHVCELNTVIIWLYED